MFFLLGGLSFQQWQVLCENVGLRHFSWGCGGAVMLWVVLVLKTLGVNVDRGQFTSRFCHHRKHSCPDQRSLCKAHGDPRKTYRVLTSSSSPLEAELERTWEGNLANAGWCCCPGVILDRTWQLRGIPDIPCKNWQVWKLPLLDDLTNHDTRWVPAHSASFSDNNGLHPVLEMKGDANGTALLGVHGGPWLPQVWTQPWF